MGVWEEIQEIGKEGIGQAKTWGNNEKKALKALKKLGVDIKVKQGEVAKMLDKFYKILSSVDDKKFHVVEKDFKVIQEKIKEYLGGISDHMGAVDASKNPNKEKAKDILNKMIKVLSLLWVQVQEGEEKVTHLYKMAKDAGTSSANGDSDKIPKMVVLLEHKDIAPKIGEFLSKKFGRENIHPPHTPIKITIDDPKVLKHMSNPAIQQKAVDAANFRELVKQIYIKTVEAIIKLDAHVEDRIEEAYEKIVAIECTLAYDRAIEEVKRLSKVSFGATKYKAKIVIKGAFAIGGLVSGATGAAGALASGAIPLAAAGLYSAWKGIVATLELASASAREAEAQVGVVAKKVTQLEEAWHGANPPAEVTKNFLNILMGGNFVTTVRNAGEANDVLKGKIDIIEKEGLKLAKLLHDVLKAQGELTTTAKREKLGENELVKEILKTMKTADVQIKHITAINERVNPMVERHKELTAAIRVLSDAEGKAAKVITSTMKIATSAIGFMTMNTGEVSKIITTSAKETAKIGYEIYKLAGRIKHHK